MFGRRKKELWENLAVVWKQARPIPGHGPWFLTNVINHNASADPQAPKIVLGSEIAVSQFYGDVIEAKTKEEAMLKYAASGHASGSVWSIDKGGNIAAVPDGLYRLVREEIF